MFAQFFIWWLRQMHGLTPRWLDRGAGATDAMVIAIDGYEDDAHPASGRLLYRRNGSEAFAGMLDFSRGLPEAASSLPACLRLPPGEVLQRDVSLPLAAERDLASMLGYEMDRLTPFAGDEVFWGVTGLRRDPAQGRLDFTLSIALRAPLESLLASLGRLNLRPEFIECEAGRIPLATRRHRARWRVARYLSCGALALACLAVPVVRQQLALDASARQIAALQPAAATAIRLRQKITVAASGQAAVAAAAQNGDAVRTLAALTQALPDGTWLADLTLKSGQLTMDGQSGDAAQLVATLAGLPGFHNPGFSAPVTRAVNGNTDLFSIHLTVGP